MATDLNDQELDELDQLLGQVPEGLDPLDVVMLDGYLAGVIVQPRLIPVEEWLPPVFDLDGRARPFDMDPAWLERTHGLIERRMAALNRGLAEEGWFDPILPQEVPEFEDSDSEDAKAWAELPEASRAVSGWVAGFQYALTLFSDLEQQADERIHEAVDRLLRHLPAEDDTQRAAAAAVQVSHPVSTVDEGVADMVSAVAELWELTTGERYKVATVRRDAPKVGRNDPCPCGSGKKFKACHGK